MKYLEDFTVGERWSHPDTYTVSEEEIMEVGRRWDPQVFHTDPEAARDTFFGGLVASTGHMFNILTALSTGPGSEPVAAVSALGFDKLRIVAPTRPGDVITAHSEILEVRPSESRPGTGIMRARCELRNQRGEAVFTGESASLVERRPIS